MTAPTLTLLETILESLEEGVIALDRDGRITAINNAAERLLGRSRALLVGQSFVDACHPGTPLIAALDTVQNGEIVKLAEATLPRRGVDLEVITVSATVTPLFPPPQSETPRAVSDAPQGAVITLRDIGRTKELEELVRRSERVRTIGIVAAGLAHEIKNPLSGIRGAAQLLKRSVPADEREGCDIILREVDRLRGLVEELLDAGHPRTLTLASVNVHQVLHRALSLIPAMQQRRIQLVEQYDPSLPDIRGDADALHQVFLNLFANAADAVLGGHRDAADRTPPMILLRTGVVGDALRLDSMPRSRGMAMIRIADNGPGIPPDVLPRLFTPFFTTKDEGTGLGLVVSHRIVTEHGGGIQVETFDAGGAAFTVYLPLASGDDVEGARMILVVDDDRSVRWVLRKTLEASGYEVQEAVDGAEAWETVQTHPEIALIFMDVRMPKLDGLEVLKRIHSLATKPDVVIMTAQNTLETALLAMKEGAFDYVAKPFKVEEIEHLAERALSMRRLAQEVTHLRAAVASHATNAPRIIGSSPAMQEVMKAAGRVSRSDVTVLLEGESGTGKELIARTIHTSSPRVAGPFVAVNLAAVPANLMESELMGYEKGAFTGAGQTTPGKIELADKGTLFLDEVGDMPLELQGKLLRVLQEREFYRLGGKTSRTVDIRVIAATNKDLQGMMLRGEFREDLFYRLRVVPIYLPPLRERRDDINPLIDFFLAKYREELDAGDKSLSTSGRTLLNAAPWPGNVRQLEHALMRALVLSRGPVLVPEDFPDLVPEQKRIDANMTLAEIIEAKIRPLIDTMDDVPEGNLYMLLMNEMEKPLLKLAMDRAGGNQIRAARALGINRNTLRKKLADHSLKGR